MIVYISGQISGLPLEVARANFAKAESKLIAQGYEVANPTRNGLDPAAAWEKHIAEIEDLPF